MYHIRYPDCHVYICPECHLCIVVLNATHVSLFSECHWCCLILSATFACATSVLLLPVSLKTACVLLSGMPLACSSPECHFCVIALMTPIMCCYHRSCCPTWKCVVVTGPVDLPDEVSCCYRSCGRICWSVLCPSVTRMPWPLCVAPSPTSLGKNEKRRPKITSLTSNVKVRWFEIFSQDHSHRQAGGQTGITIYIIFYNYLINFILFNMGLQIINITVIFFKSIKWQ